MQILRSWVIQALKPSQSTNAVWLKLLSPYRWHTYLWALDRKKALKEVEVTCYWAIFQDWSIYNWAAVMYKRRWLQQLFWPHMTWHAMAVHRHCCVYHWRLAAELTISGLFDAPAPLPTMVWDVLCIFSTIRHLSVSLAMRKMTWLASKLDWMLNLTPLRSCYTQEVVDESGHRIDISEAVANAKAWDLRTVDLAAADGTSLKPPLRLHQS